MVILCFECARSDAFPRIEGGSCAVIDCVSALVGGDLARSMSAKGGFRSVGHSLVAEDVVRGSVVARWGLRALASVFAQDSARFAAVS